MGAIAIVKAEAVKKEDEGRVKSSGIFKQVGSGKVRFSE
jgi:hypothetical protein